MSFLLLQLPHKSKKNILLQFITIMIPFTGTCVLIFSPTLKQILQTEAWVGANSFSHFFISLQAAVFYETQSLTSLAGIPGLDYITYSWTKTPFPEFFHAFFFSISMRRVLGGLILIFCSFPFLNNQKRWKDSIKLPSFSLILCFIINTLLFLFLEVQLPKNRLLLHLIPMIFLCGTLTLDNFICTVGKKIKVFSQMIIILSWMILMANFFPKYSLTVYREFPKCAAFPKILSIIKEIQKGKETTIGCSWYHDECVRYYKDKYQADWIKESVNIIPMKEPTTDYIITSSYFKITEDKDYATIHKDNILNVALKKRLR